MIPILDDDPQRLDAFCRVAPQLGEDWYARTARNAPAWIELAKTQLAGARLISLDHDLDPTDAGVAEPGTGRDAADWLATQRPVCPVIVHTSNTDAAWGMYNVLTRAKWAVYIVHHLNDAEWIRERWLPEARRIVALHAPLRRTQDMAREWLLGALSVRPQDRFKALEKELDSWPEESRARALFRLAVGGYAPMSFRAADMLVERQPELGYTCEQALRIVAASYLNPDAQGLAFYLVTEYGRLELRETLHRLWKEEYHEKGLQLAHGLNSLEYWLRPPTRYLRPVRSGWKDWRDSVPEAQDRPE